MSRVRKDCQTKYKPACAVPVNNCERNEHGKRQYAKYKNICPGGHSFPFADAAGDAFRKNPCHRSNDPERISAWAEAYSQCYALRTDYEQECVANPDAGHDHARLDSLAKSKTCAAKYLALKRLEQIDTQVDDANKTKIPLLEKDGQGRFVRTQDTSGGRLTAAVALAEKQAASIVGPKSWNACAIIVSSKQCKDTSGCKWKKKKKRPGRCDRVQQEQQQ